MTRGVLGQEVFGGAGCHLAEALHGHGASAEGIATPHGGGAGAHSHVDAQPGHYGSVPAAAEGGVQAHYILGFLAHGFQVPSGGADVGGGDIAPAQGIDETAPGAQQALGFLGAGVANDNALAAAQVEAGGGGFVGHGAGQAQGVGDGVGFGGIVPHPGAAAGGAQGSIVDGDDAAEARFGVAVHRHLLVALLRHCVQSVHCLPLLCCPAAGRLNLKVAGGLSFIIRYAALFG